MKKPIAGATDAELRKFAEDKYGLTFGPQGNGAKRETILKKLLMVHSADTPIDVGPIEGGGEESPAVQAQTQPAQAQPDLSPPMDPAAHSAAVSKSQRVGGQGSTWVWVMINSQQGDFGEQPVDLYCNGKQIWVPRDKWCRIRSGYAESLKNAIEYRYKQEKDAEGLNKINPVPEQVHRYPHQIWKHDGEPPKADQYVPPEHTQMVARPAA